MMIKNAATVCLLATLVAFAGHADEIINLNRRPVSFTNLCGKVYTNVILIKADLDGIYFTEPNLVGGSRISLTNIESNLLLSWGIPTNRIAIAALRADKKAESDKRYRKRLSDVAAKDIEEKAARQKFWDLEDASTGAKAVEDSKSKLAIRAQEDVVRQLERQTDRLRDRWISHDIDDFKVTSNSGIGGGTYVDSEQNRKNAYFNSKEALRTAREKLEDMRGKE